MNRWRIWNSTTVGMAASTAPAANTPKLLLRSPATRPNRPTARVLDSGSVRKTLAIRNSLTYPMNPSSPVTARIGVIRGRMIPKKIWAWVAPSTRADSSRSLGMVSRNPFISQVFAPRAPPRYRMVSDHGVLKPILG
jgi:hypothetical protein